MPLLRCKFSLLLKSFTLPRLCEHQTNYNQMHYLFNYILQMKPKYEKTEPTGVTKLIFSLTPFRTSIGIYETTHM